MDIGAVLDPAWEVSGAQGVKLYSATGEIDLSGYNITVFDDPQNNGTDVCFQNAIILTGQTVLLNIKTTMQDGLSEAAIGDTPFTFSGSLTESGSSCSGILEPLASPNPVTAD